MKKIQEIMTKNIETISPTLTLKEAAKKMKDVDTGALPVFDGKETLGMITDRDIVVRVLAEDRDPMVTRVSEAMSQGVVTCLPHDDVTKAADLMKKHQIRRLLVVDEKKQPMGIISLGDLALEGSSDQAAEALEKVSKPKSTTAA